MKHFLFLTTIVFLTTACSGTYQDYLRMKDIPPPTIENFYHCYNYGCKTKAIISLPLTTQDTLNQLFTPPSKTAEEERQKISRAIKIFENDIGAITGTKNDKRGTFRLYQDNAKTTKSFQQDCVDESTNTTIYLALLHDMGYLKFYEPAFPTSRQPFFGGAPWWHQTAVMKEISSGGLYVVDSWFRDNGHPAFVVPLQEWKDGWMPPKLPAGT